MNLTDNQWNVPVVDVNNDNFTVLWPSMLFSIKNASFIALDTELSGLGDRKKLNAKDLEERYQSIAEVARSRSILSLGISCFKIQSDEIASNKKTDDITGEADGKDLHATMKKNKVRSLPLCTQTFNITVLCQENYVVEPISLEFLVDHGFDFNKQYAKGVPYVRGKQTESLEPSIRQLFSELIKQGVPVVLHNGLVDIIFLYHSFYTNVPKKQSTFLADLSEIFPEGIYDTKYITEYEERMEASYLEYVFKKSQRANNVAVDNNEVHVTIQFLQYEKDNQNILYRDCSTNYENIPETEICDAYANHGWCPLGRKCKRSHDIDCILNRQPPKRKKKTKKKHRKRKNEQIESSSLEKVSEKPFEAGSKELGLNDEDFEIEDAKVLKDETDENNRNDKDVGNVDSMVSTTDVGSMVSTTDIGSMVSTTDVGSMVSTTDVGSMVSTTDVGSMVSTTDVGSMVSTTDVGSMVSSKEGTDIASEERVDSGENGQAVVTEAGDDVTTEKRQSDKTESAGHRAGFDAFMTGFIMARYVAKYGRIPSGMADISNLSKYGLESMVNKLYLSCKDIPMMVQRSSYAKTSKDHEERWLQMNSSSS